MSIPFTQYLRPDGRTKGVEIDRPAEIEDAAKRLIDSGCVFEIEELSDGTVSMTCERDDEVLAHELCPNGPDVPTTVDRMIQSALVLVGSS